MKKTPETATNLQRDIGSVFLIAIVFVLLTWMGWMKWNDPIIDFGAEIYVPWQLHEGAVLYRDLASFKGPFSPYLNTLWFTLFGVSLRTLVFANLSILALCTGALTLFVRRLTDRLTATVTAIVFLTEFGLSNIVTSNFNFATPFVHELTHGITLCMLLLLLLQKIIHAPTAYRAVLAGLLFGCILLTRVEIGMAATGIIVMTAIILLRHPPKIDLSFLRLFLIFCGGTLLMPLLSFAYFSAHMPPLQALNGMLGTWKDLWNTNVASTYFFQRVTGLETPGASFLQAAGSALLLLNWVMGALMMERMNGKKLSDTQWLLTMGIATACVGIIALTPFPPLMNGRGLTIITSFIAIYTFTRMWRKKEYMLTPAQWGMWTVLSIFAGLMIGKIFLNARIWHYGFVHAMPATVLVILTLLWLIPKHLQFHGYSGRIFRGIALAMIIIDALCMLRISSEKFETKTLRIGSGTDTFLSFNDAVTPQGHIYNDLLNAINTHIPATATLTPLPEGLMINYLTRHKSSVPYLNFMVTEMSIFGEATMLEAFEKNPPDYIALVQRNTADFGVSHFGINKDYGASIVDWVRLHYTPIWSKGGNPLLSPAFSAELLQRIK